MSQWINKLPLAPIQLAVLVLATYFAIHCSSLWTVSMLCLLLTLLFIRWGLKTFQHVLLLLAVVASFFLWQRWQWPSLARTPSTNLHHLSVIPDSLAVNGDRLSFRGRAENREYQVFYRLANQEEQAYFQELTDWVELEVEAEVEAPEARRNFNGFDYQAYLATEGIHQVVTIQRIRAIKRLTPWHPMDWLSTWRRAALVHCKKAFPAPMRHYMTGLLFGELDSEFDQMGDVYSSLGIIHLFALSGMQVGFFIDGFRHLLLRFGLTKETVHSLLLPFSVVYAGLTGYSISVIRSLLQKNMGYVGLRGLDNLAMTAFVCLLLVPRFPLTMGGGLTFAYALLLTVFDFERLTSIRRIFSESVALALGMLPILLYYFSSFQALSILLTAVFSFLFDLILLPGLTLAFLLSPFINLSVCNGLFVLLERLISWVADRGFPPWIGGRPSEILLVLLVVSLCVLYDYQRKKKLVLIMTMVIALLFFLTKHPLENEVTMLDVGQGDSLFLRDMSGKTLLIDVGGRVEFGGGEDWRKGSRASNAERTLLPYLYSRGVGRIDSLVLTHTDTDHVGDVLEVAQQVQIGRIYVSQGSLTNPDFVATLREIGAPVYPLTIGDRLPIMHSHLEVLYPAEVGDGGNDDSLVLYGELLGSRFLFTGDLESGELDLIEAYPDLKVDVLKAGHHGSKGSSYPEFLAHIQPAVALISAGKNNRYQHPHQETLERLEQVGAQVFRTDQQGAVRFRGVTEWIVETVR